jgi:anti-sigma regulatory factor (Ser/Thr protein kinase)
MTAAQHTFEVTRDPAQVKMARVEICDVLRRWGLDEYAEDLRLCVSELVTNALRHGEGLIEVHLVHEGRQLRCEVYDDSPMQPWRRPVSVDVGAGGGLGLPLIDNIIGEYGGAWGVVRPAARPGKAVFLELPLKCPPSGAKPMVSAAYLSRVSAKSWLD